jgi:hypothetical protein
LISSPLNVIVYLMTGANQPPSRETSAEIELTHLINLPERADNYIGPSALDGEGVNPQFIDTCRAQISRIDQTHESTFPRDPQGITYRFFKGEARGYSRLPNAVNPVNNPLDILRPLVLTTPSNMTYYGIGPSFQGPRSQARSVSERGGNDTSLENAYRRGVKAFEELFVTALEATNQESFAASLEVIDPSLRQIDEVVGKQPYARETTAGWLMHASLAVLIHPSEHIKPAGRLRALTLLSRFSTEELIAGFMSASKNNFLSAHGSGLANFLPPRIPHTMCPPHLHAATEHRGWEHEPAMQAIFGGQWSSSDYRTTSNNIYAHPREAVQLTLLALHTNGEFGVELLRNLPNLARPLLEEMFGPRATFYVDNNISNTLTEQVAQGMGTQFDPTADFEGLTGRQLERLNRDELAQLLGAALVRLRRSEEIIGQMATDPTLATATRESTSRDPEGYYAALGLNPEVLGQYDGDQLKIILEGAHRAMSRLWHPDHAEQGNAADKQERAERQQFLNTARDRLLNSDFRSGYGRRRP